MCSPKPPPMPQAPPARQAAIAPTIDARTEMEEQRRGRSRGYAGLIMTPQGGAIGMPATAGRTILGG